MELRKLIADIRDGWLEYRRLKVVSGGHPEYKLIVEDFPRELGQLLPEASACELQGSTGRGNITAAPWIATFDPTVTRSATQGFYLVYLFSVDLRRVYLSIAFGITQFETYFKNPDERKAKLLAASKHLSSLIQANRFFIVGALDLAAANGSLHADYERSNIVAILYELDALPSGEQLADDYRYMLSVYSDLVRNPLLPDIQQLLEAQIDPPPTSDPIVVEFVPRPPIAKRERGEIAAGNKRRISRESKKIGDRGEQIVFDHEAKRFMNLGHDPSQLKWLAREGKTPGWDISSVDDDGTTLYIEVKASVSSSVSNLVLTRTEYRAAETHKEKYCIYLVTDVMKEKPTIEIIRDPIKRIDAGELTATVDAWLVGLAPRSIE